MSNFKKLAFSGFLLISGSLLAQVSNPVVVEHFTNTRCSVCAGQNPSFNNILTQNPQVMRIAYHPTSPYQNCLLAQHNVAENDARTNWYGIYGSTPRLAIMGAAISNNPNPYQNPNLYESYTGGTSPFETRIQQWKTADSTGVRVVVRRTAGGGNSDLRVWCAVAEDTVFYNSPNGESRHYNVFRRSFSGHPGWSINLSSPGDSVVLTGKLARHAAWNFDRIFAFALVQDGSTKALRQSAFTPARPLVLTDSEKALQENQLQVYPQPSNGKITIDGIKEEIQLWSMNGKWIQTLRTNQGPRQEVQVPQPGMYILRTASGQSRKVVNLGY